MFKKKDQPRTDIFDIAPHLEEPKARAERLERHRLLEEEKEHLRKVGLKERVAAAYRATRQQEAEQGNA